MFRLLIVLAYLVMVAALPLTAGAAQTTPSLAGTSWTLSETAVQRAAPMPAVGNPRPTLTFGTDGRVSGNTGCNSFSGTYTQSGGNVTFGALAMTQALRDGSAEILAANAEDVARALGFRSPTSFCHAFHRAGLPSPQRVQAELLAS